MKRVDFLIGLAMAGLGSLLGVLVLRQAGTLFFYQNFTPEVVYSACGYGLRHPAIVPPKLLAFLFREKTYFDCADIDPTAILNPPGLFALMQLYFGDLVALVWRISSVRYENLWPLVGALSGFYSVGSFALLRQFFGRISATAGAVFLSLSPVALPLIFVLRDYAKAPFFMWAIVFIVLTLRSRELKAMLGWSAASAAVVGLGCGFRADLIILLPLAIVTLLITWDLKLFGLRILATLLFIAITIAGAFPIISNGNGGTYGSLIIQGMSDPFRDYLKMGPTPYSFGARYSDELVLSSIAADERPRHLDWDENEGKPVYGVSQATTLSGANWQRFVPYFPADFVAQAFKSAGWVLGFPVLAAADRLPDPGFPVMQGPPISVFMEPLYTRLAQHWMPWLGMVGMFFFFWRIWARSKQEAIALAFLFTALLTYPVVQFSIRHIFHLEVIWVCAMLALFELPYGLRSMRQSGIWYPTIIGVTVAVALVTYQLLIREQRTMLIPEIENLLAEPKTLLFETGPDQTAANTEIAVPVPLAYDTLVHSPPDSMTKKIGEIGIQWDVRSAADRLLFTLSGRGCGDQFKITANYEKTSDVWQPMDQIYSVPPGQPSDGALIVVPAFYRPTQHLRSFSFTNTAGGCHVKLERLEGNSIFPKLMSLVLPVNWRGMPLHLGFGAF